MGALESLPPFVVGMTAELARQKHANSRENVTNRERLLARLFGELLTRDRNSFKQVANEVVHDVHALARNCPIRVNFFEHFEDTVLEVLSERFLDHTGFRELQDPASVHHGRRYRQRSRIGRFDRSLIDRSEYP